MKVWNKYKCMEVVFLSKAWNQRLSIYKFLYREQFTFYLSEGLKEK